MLISWASFSLFHMAMSFENIYVSSGKIRIASTVCPVDFARFHHFHIFSHALVC